MFKKFVAFLLSFLLFVPSITLAGSTEASTNSNKEDSATNLPVSTINHEDYAYSIDLSGITTLDELETHIEEHLANNITSLVSRQEILFAEIDTYEKYCNDSERVSEFYQTIVTETEQMCIMLCEYSAAYARMILDSDMSADDKYDAVDGINDCLYEDACDEIHDEIYEGILEDMYDYFYEGILDDAEDDANYSDWYNVCSAEYQQWHDASSEVYELYYDAASDIYSFYYDIMSEIYSRDFDRAEKQYERFLEKIAKAKGIDTGDAVSNATFDTSLRIASNVKELESVVDAHVSECVQALRTEWETLSTEIDTFDEYQNNVDAIEEFHIHIEDSASQILVMICNYGISYTNLILQSGASAKDMYKEFENFNDCIYEDACEIVKDEIYEDLLEEIKDYYYDGVIDDAQDTIKYSDWADTRSDVYSWWSDARSDVYDEWSDTRSDIYRFYSDVRSALYSGDIDKANDELQDFRNKYSSETTKPEQTKESAITEDSSANSGIDPDFMSAMNSYETFMDEYVTFIKKYSDNPSDLGLLADYAKFMVDYAKFVKEFEEWEDADLNAEETKYYLAVQNRVAQKLLEIV